MMKIINSNSLISNNKMKIFLILILIIKMKMKIRFNLTNLLII